MSQEQPEKQSQNQQNNLQHEQQHEQHDPDKLTEQDQQKYRQIVASIAQMNQKIKKAKDLKSKKQNPSAQQATQIAIKLIQAKENSQIITKQNLIEDVHQSYQKAVVEVYTENKRLQKHIKILEKIIKDQHQKILIHQQKQDNLQKLNDKLRQEINQIKDQQLLNKREPQKQHKQPINPKNGRSPKSQTKNDQHQDYDFWNMPQNQSYISKKKDYVSDSGLWANQKQIGQSMFITQQQTKGKKY